MKIYLETYGCTLNQADSDIIRGVLRDFLFVDNPEEADVVILNTCTVKGATENKILNRIKELKDKRLVVAGCLSVNEKSIRKVAPSATILWPGSISKIKEAIGSEGATIKDDDYKDYLPREFTAPILRMPIQEGCTGNCFFCQTKLARPVLRSYSPKTIVRWVEEGLGKGAKEIQITGMDAGAYGMDIKTNLIELLGHILEIEGDFRIRVGMVNPNHVKRMERELIGIYKDPKMYKFLHIPVQSGSERVVKEMNRPHTVKDFEGIVERFREGIPGITIATDIIVGYPTENEKDFEDSKELMERVRPDVVNISRFTPRPGTKAKEMKQLDTKIVKKRTVEFSELCKRIAKERNKGLVGQEYGILITEKQKDYTGRNDFYKQVVVKGFKGGLGERIKVKIRDANHGSLIGGIVDK